MASKADSAESREAQAKQEDKPVRDGCCRKRSKQMISSYSILLIITFAVGILTMIVALFNKHVTAVSFSDIVMSPIKGVLDGIEISLFLLVFGGCMGVVNKVGAIDAGIRTLVHKLRGRELVLVPVIMAIFALLGSTYGFCEETIPFYALLGAVMFMAGYDTIVSSATVLFGAGVGCLGSTVNPFANGVAIATLHDSGIEVNQGAIILMGIVLVVVSYLISLYFILKYAHKIKRDKGSTLMSLQEQQDMDETFGEMVRKEQEATKKNGGVPVVPEFTRRHKITLVLFALTFVIMIVGFIPWQKFNINIFDAGSVTVEKTTPISAKDIQSTWDDKADHGTLTFKGDPKAEITTTHTSESWSGRLTGSSIGDWYFNDASAWFFVMALVIAWVAKLSESDTVDAFIKGAGEMVGVALVVGLARAISNLMSLSGLDTLILQSASHSLQGLSAMVFAPLSYLVYLGLSVIITSTSALASVSMPIMGPLTKSLGFSPDVMVMIFVAANGLANLFSPTAVFLPGLMMARLQYSTYLKWAWKPILLIAIASVVILTVGMLILH